MTASTSSCVDNILEVDRLVDATLDPVEALIPDSYDSEQFLSRAIRSEIEQKAIAPLEIERLTGLDGTNKRARRKRADAERDIENLRARLEQPARDILPNLRDLSAERLEKVKEILAVFQAINHQVSEQFLAYVLDYALAATAPNAPSAKYFFTVSIGGDQEPAPYVEAYLVPPLSVLRSLKRLQVRGIVSFLPKFVVISTHNSQVVENHFDKLGRPIEPLIHQHNSLTTLQRLQSFAENFFADVNNECLWLEYPVYERYSQARLFCALAWDYIPLPPESRERLFQIKGNVVDTDRDSGDWLETHLKDFNAYVPRHLFSTMLLSPAHTLRFAAERTEAPFHFAVSSLLPVLKQKGDRLIESIQALARELPETLRPLAHSQYAPGSLSFELALTKQIYSISSKIHAQVGIPDLHCCYYKHPDEPSLAQMIETGSYSAEELRQLGRSRKAAQLERTFNRVTEAIGLDDYLDFLSDWYPKYLSLGDSNETVKPALARQRDALQAFVLPSFETRLLMNYWLL